MRNCAVCLWQTCGARECEGKNYREREVFAALRSPLSLRFSPSRSLSPYPLPSAALNLSAADSRGIGFRKAGDRGRKPKGKGECELCEYPPSTWVVTPVSWGEMTHGIEWSKLGKVMPANLVLFEFAYIRTVCSRYTQHIRRALDQRRPALPTNFDLSYYAAETIRILCVPKRCRKALDQRLSALPANSTVTMRKKQMKI